MLIDNPVAAAAAAFVCGYLLGSIPFGLILTSWVGLGDIRAIGSGNIGATNVLRTGRKGLAAVTLLLDALKGTAAVLLALHFLGPQPALAAALGAFLGHIAPVWLGFRGGKGVATYIGILIALDWRAALVFAVLWLAVAFASRYSSLAALVASAITPLAVWWLGSPNSALLLGLLALILWVKHRANISRLLAGTEGRIGQKG
jgi:glycerol-3-phosphate acyltransferase PlsY